MNVLKYRDATELQATLVKDSSVLSRDKMTLDKVEKIVNSERVRNMNQSRRFQQQNGDNSSSLQFASKSSFDQLPSLSNERSAFRL